jgi:SnoaL-like domain
MDLREWIERYGRAWEMADEASIVTLFTEDARYRSSPFREPHVGHDEIRAYWQRATGSQRSSPRASTHDSRWWPSETRRSAARLDCAAPGGWLGP